MVAITRVRVRYGETDTMGIVYYANYLVYMEVGRVEFLRQHGHPISDVDTKIHIPVVEATVKYLKPARLDDLLEVRCWISDRRRASFTFSYEVAHAESGELVATGETRHACVDPQSQKVVEIPDWLKKVMSEDAADSA